MKWEFPGGPVFRTPCFHWRGPSSIPGQGTNIPQAMWHCQKKNEVLIHATTWMNPENIMLSEKMPVTKDHILYIYMKYSEYANL